MKKFIVPVDFSETSINAARFAAKLTEAIGDSAIILYNVFENVEAGSDGTPLESDDEGRKSVMELVLKSIKTDISNATSAPISIVAEEDNDFVGSLERYVRHNNVDIIVMGITGATRLSQIVMGSNTLKVLRRKIAPVFIIPPDAQFALAKNIAMISDFKDVDKTVPAGQLKNVLGMLKASLHVLNVDSDHYIELTDEYKEQKARLDKILKDFNPTYSFMRLFDFVEAIDAFVKDYNIDMLLTIPKNDSLFSNFFKTTHTSKLAYHSRIPIIAIHS
ncbi:MAG: universal stress protein [Bacteroidetes bacterium]|nr:universal stress protein [Bacteroidota bacterium]MBS1973019.1 universal stress protein [Bacteroidota bacterium]